MTLDLAVRLFIQSRENGTDGAKKEARPSTIQNYKYDLAIFTEWLKTQGILKYEDIDRSVMLKFVEWMKEQKWSHASKMKRYRALRAFFRWVDRDEDCREEDLKNWQKALPLISKPKPRTYIPSKAELKRWRSSFGLDRTTDFRNYVMFCVMLDTGMRVGELRLLKMDNLALDENAIMVPQLGKTGSRLVRVTLEVNRLMRRWLRRREKVAKCDRVFVSDDGKPLGYWAVTQAFIKHRAEHKLPPISPHTLRHAFCTYYLRGGGSLEKLKAITGHSSYQILDDYVHLAEIGGKEIQAELEQVSPLKQIAGD